MIASELPAPTLLAALEAHWVPHVFVNRAIPGAVSNVVMDVARASELAVEHLHGLGHRRIGHVAGPAEVESALRREEAFLAAARRRGPPRVGGGRPGGGGAPPRPPRGGGGGGRGGGGEPFSEPGGAAGAREL